MKIAGLQKLTLIDYPGHLACTVFLPGCNFRCPWCYSRELVLPEEIKKQPTIPEKEFFDFLQKRTDLLQGVVVCGGEPTVFQDLPEFMEKIKKLGYLTKLDTNGSHPQMMEELISKNLVDYIAMDVKLPKDKYSQIFFDKKISPDDIQKSIDLLKKEKVDYEFRTTVVPTIHEKEDILAIAQWIKPARRYSLQNFRAEKTIDPSFEKIKPYPREFLVELQKLVAPFFEFCQVK